MPQQQFPVFGRRASESVLQCYKGPRTQIIGFYGPNTIVFMVFGRLNPIIWVLGPLGIVPKP